MYNDILDRYRKGYVTDTQLAQYVALNVITPEQQQALLNDGVALTLEQAKAQRIAQAETDLEAYLEAHPITWTDGHTYGITATQQAQLTSKIAVAQAKATLSAPYDLTWNATDGACTSWELADLLALAFAIDGRVTALESYKQDKVLEIKAAETVEALAAVVVDYDSVPLA